MLNPFLTGLAVVSLLFWLAGAIEMGWGNRRIVDLADVPPLSPGAAPRLSVVIAARDEERNVEAALRSVLRQSYPELEVVVVDDRSSDATGPILDRMEMANRHLRVLHVEELPPGWLGKNHALHVGATQATGEWILFTDADVVMDSTATARAVAYAQAEDLDHLAAAPGLVSRGPLLDLFVGLFALLFARFTQPWKARDPRSRRHIGVGAFNLVRAEAYRAVGGHRPIAMRPDDDLKLGKLLKREGHRQDLVFGRGMISVEWYASVREAVRGLEKNAFAGLEYSVAAVLGSTLSLLVLGVWPFLAVWVTDGLAQALSAATIVVMVAIYAASTRASGANPLYGVLLPVPILLLVYAVWRSTLVTLRQGGIRWRGTHYPLAELRANRV